MNEFPVMIYHNPGCGTSRNALAIIRAAGYAPTVVEYLKTGWERRQLEGLLAATGMRPAELLRTRGTPAGELGLMEPGTSDAAILEAMLAHPVLVNRPIVMTPLGTKLCRPSEVVLSLLERAPEGFTKEDGRAVGPGPAG
jgi:arsenate reductase (glutaredoxin)